MTINKSIQYFKKLFGNNDNNNTQGSNLKKCILNIETNNLDNTNNNLIRDSIPQCSGISFRTSTNDDIKNSIHLVNSECKEVENITRQNSNITITNLVVSVNKKFNKSNNNNTIKETLRQEENDYDHKLSTSITSSSSSLFPEIDYDQFDPNSPNYISILPCSFPIIH